MSEWKETELGLLPNHWEIKSIGSLIEDNGISVGVMYPGEHCENGISIIKAGDIKDGRINQPITNKISENVNFQYKRTILKGGELLVVLVGDSGTTAVVSADEIGYNVARAIGVLKLKQPEEAQFISYCLKFRPVKAILDSFCNTTVQRTLNLKELKDVILPWPKNEERSFIKKTISSIDSKITLLHQQNETLEELAQTLFNQIISEENQENEVSLHQLANIGIGRTPPRKEDQWFSKSANDVKWISIKDMGLCGVYINNTSEYLTKEAVSRFSIPVIPKNTVVLSFKMTLGRVAITTEEMLSNEAIAHFKIKDDSLISTEYLYFFLKTYKYQNLGSTSSIVTSINSGMIKNIEIIMPKKDKMLQFSNSVKPLFKAMKSNSEQIDTITSLRDTLLPKLMSGELTLNRN